MGEFKIEIIFFPKGAPKGGPQGGVPQEGPLGSQRYSHVGSQWDPPGAPWCGTQKAPNKMGSAAPNPRRGPFIGPMGPQRPSLGPLGESHGSPRAHPWDPSGTPPGSLGCKSVLPPGRGQRQGTAPKGPAQFLSFLAVGPALGGALGSPLGPIGAHGRFIVEQWCHHEALMGP